MTGLLGIIHLVRTQKLLKNNPSYLLLHTRTCAYQGVRNFSFWENFAYVLNEWTLFSKDLSIREIKYPWYN